MFSLLGVDVIILRISFLLPFPPLYLIPENVTHSIFVPVSPSYRHFSRVTMVKKCLKLPLLLHACFRSDLQFKRVVGEGGGHAK
jgi:hypothetical protein